MDVKSGSVAVKFVSYPKASGIAVVVSWECPNGSQTALNCLRNEQACDTKGVAETAAAYAMALGIEGALLGDPVSAAKNQVSGVCYNALNKMFSISYSAKGSATVLGRTLKAILKALQPKKYGSALATLMRSVGQSIGPEAKRHLEAHMVSNLKKGLIVSVVGKMKVEKAKLQTIIDGVAAKFPDLKEPAGKKTAPEISKSLVCPNVNTKVSHFSASGLNMVYLFYYLHNKLKQDADIDDGKLTISKMGDKAIASLKKKATVSAYVSSKYGKLKDLLSEGTLYFASLSGMSDAHTLSKASGITVAAIEKGITDAL